MADNQGDEGRPESNSGDLDKSLQERIKRRAQADWRGASPWAGHRRHGTHRAGIVFAFLMIGAGVLLFLENIGLFHFHDIWRYWPVALIALGVSKLFETRGAGGMVWAAMAMLVGTAFLLDNLGIWHASWNMIWPLGLIAFGVLMLVNALERRRSPDDPACVKTYSDTSSDNMLRAWATFSGLKRRLDTQIFRAVRCWRCSAASKWTCAAPTLRHRQRSRHRCQRHFRRDRHQGAGDLARGHARPGYLRRVRRQDHSSETAGRRGSSDAGYHWLRRIRRRLDRELSGRRRYSCNASPSLQPDQFPSVPDGLDSDRRHAGPGAQHVGPTELGGDEGHHCAAQPGAGVCLPVALVFDAAFCRWVRLPSGNC